MMNLASRFFWMALWGMVSLLSTPAFSQFELSSPDSSELQQSTLQENEKSDEITSLQSLRDLIGASEAQTEFLDPNVAYLIDIQAKDADTLTARFTIEDGYYLYRDKTKFKSQTEGVSLVEPSLLGKAMKDRSCREAYCRFLTCSEPRRPTRQWESQQALLVINYKPISRTHGVSVL